MAGRGDTVFLCGVFQSATVIDFATTVGPNGRIVALEANPTNVETLLSEVKLPNVHILNRAVWHRDEDLEFEFADADDAQHYNRVHDSRMQPFPTHIVDSPKLVNVRGELIGTTADKLGIKRIDHLNLTVNGAEMEAFRGDAGAALAKRVHRIYTHTELPNPGSELRDRLTELGFRTRMSQRLQSRNRLIDLRRLYAWSD